MEPHGIPHHTLVGLANEAASAIVDLTGTIWILERMPFCDGAGHTVRGSDCLDLDIEARATISDIRSNIWEVRAMCERMAANVGATGEERRLASRVDTIVEMAARLEVVSDTLSPAHPVAAHFGRAARRIHRLASRFALSEAA